MLPCRTFFGPFRTREALRKVHRETTIIPVNMAVFCDVVSDVGQYKEFLPFCVDSKVVRRVSDKEFEAELAVGFKVFTETYTSRVTVARPHSVRSEMQGSSIFEHLISSWQLRDLGGTRCAVDFTVDFAVAPSLQAEAVKIFFTDTVQAQVQAFTERAIEQQRRWEEAQEASKGQKKQLEAQNQRQRSKQEPRQPQPPQPPAHQAQAQPHAQPSDSTDQPHLHVQAQPPIQTDISLQQPTGQHSNDRQTHLKASMRAEQGEGSGSKADALVCVDRIGDMSLAELTRLQEIFTQHARPTAGGARLDLEGFRQACSRLDGKLYHGFGMGFGDVSDFPALCAAVFASMDDNPPDGLMEITEFVTGVYLLGRGRPEERARHLFRICNSSADGCLTRSQLEKALTAHVESVYKVIPPLLVGEMRQLLAEGRPGAAGVVKALRECEVALQDMLAEAKKEIPLAVDQVFKEYDGHGLSLAEWSHAWRQHPELEKMMTIEGMSQMVQWASSVRRPRPASPTAAP